MSEETPLTFDGRVAIVTGGSGGIGKAISTAFCQRGGTVAIVDRRKEQTETVAQQIIETTCGTALAITVDVVDLEQVKEMVSIVKKEYGKIDILINNAGITRDNLIMRMSESDWDDVINVNLKGAWNCAKAVVREMMKSRFGRIVNIASVSGQVGQAGQSNYSASKAGLIGLTKALAREVAPRGVTVNAVAPGFIPTTLTNDLPSEIIDHFIGITPMGRMGTPEEVAAAVTFLASDDASYITGQVLGVDGGMVMM